MIRENEAVVVIFSQAQVRQRKMPTSSNSTDRPLCRMVRNWRL